MRAVLITLDLLVALPILFAALTLFAWYAYSSTSYLGLSSSGTARLALLYADSMRFYSALGSAVAYDAPPGVIYASGNESVSLLPLTGQQGCGLEYACRIVPVSGVLRLMVLR